MKRVILYGGSFDPVHHGHLIVARFVAEALHVPRVILMPSAHPPHKPIESLTPAEHRLEMCRRAVAGDDGFEVSDWECTRPGPNYTLHTVQHFREASGSATEVHWILGMDSLSELGTWYRAGELVEAGTLVTVARPGAEEPDDAALLRDFTPAQVEKLRRHVLVSPRIDISGTDIRARVAAGLSIRYLVPEPVREYIVGHGLYGAG